MIVLDTHIFISWVHGDERLTKTQTERMGCSESSNWEPTARRRLVPSCRRQNAGGMTESSVAMVDGAVPVQRGSDGSLAHPHGAGRQPGYLRG